MKGRSVVLLASLAAGLMQAAPGSAGGVTLQKTYVTVADGTQIALSISYPPGFQPGGHNYPALFEMDGYQGFPSPNDNEFFANPNSPFVDVYAQIRGTGCSGGQFDLFSQQSSEDGKYIIDNWIPTQDWSNGNVGITGHSYSGLTGFLVAETAPTHVRGVAVSGLIDDFYRSILYPGGIFNEGFPILWGALLRPESQFNGNAGNYENDPQCQQNELQHQGSDTVPVQLIAPVYTQSTATSDSWAISHSLFQNEAGLNAPIQINQQYQDEQTGPRGGYILWQNVPAGVAKRLVLSNGQHNPNDAALDKYAWLECWVIHGGQNCPTVTGEVTVAGGGVSTLTTPVNDPAARVMMYFESQKISGGQLRNEPYLTSDWPAPETNWQQYYPGADGTLSTTAGGADGSVSYVSTATDWHTTGTLGNPVGNPSSPNLGGATFTNLPDEARWTLPFAQTTTISGPMLLNLWLTSTAPDTDVFVDLIDHNTSTGEEEYLQRGLQRASFAGVDAAQSYYINSGPLAGTLYRPYHDYLTQTLTVPLTPIQVPVELFPLGHVFYPGHELIVDVHAPPANDPISTYAYEPLQPGAVNTILQDPAHRSDLLLPFLPNNPPLWSTEPTCSTTSGYVCFTPQSVP
jgi:predicted acyl esterase